MAMTLTRKATVASWIAQGVAALILAQAFFFKITGAPESVAMFRTLGAEPWGRFLTATLELAAVLLLLRPATAVYGGLLGMGLMVGAIAVHLLAIGIEVAGDGGTLFGMAVLVLVASAAVTIIRRGDLVGSASGRASRAGAAG